MRPFVLLFGVLLATGAVPAADLHGTLEIEYANADGTYRPPVHWRSETSRAPSSAVASTRIPATT
ncbi:MAG: hypothetical protein HC882_08640 [Acidobacteria bacterium]|nr:hypothetical protein [Acidobacteriota bacterium]